MSERSRPRLGRPLLGSFGRRDGAVANPKDPRGEMLGHPSGPVAAKAETSAAVLIFR